MSKDGNDIEFMLPVGQMLLHLAFDPTFRESIRKLFDRIDTGELTPEQLSAQLAASRSARKQKEAELRDALNG